ncbi:MAG: dienelactone hydrolase family protein, partial [Vulcanimicrobiaceae bacterium]
AATGAAPARLANEPLVVYVPAWGGHRWENTALASELASYGYVVAALDDVDHSSVPGAPGPRPFALETATEALASISYADWKVVREAALVSRLIDVLFADHRFAPLLDRRRIGAVGYSFGGAAAAEACRRDPRIRAVVNFDGWLWGPAASQGFPCPYLLIGEQGDVNDLRIPSERRAAAIDRSDARNQQAQFEREGGFKLLFAHTQHSSFGDAPLYSLRLRFADRALASPRDTLRIVAAYVRAFFDRTLEGRPAPLLSAPPPPGATFERFLPHRGKRSA